MPLFGNRKKPSPEPIPPPAPPAPSAPEIPRFAGDRDALRFSEQLGAGKWEDFHDFLGETTDWDLRYFYLNSLADITGRPDWLDEWAAARPGSPLPLLFRAAHGIHWAWEARGRGWGSTVSDEAWKLFHTRIVNADRDLTRVAALDDQDPAPHVFSLTTARALSLGQTELRRRYGQVTQRDPDGSAAVAPMIQGTAKKWGGSYDGMLGFARDRSQSASDGSSAHNGIARAHIEGWLAADDGGKYWTAEIGQEIRAAADRSIRSAAYRRADSVLQWQDRNLFAFCFAMLDDYDAQLAQMQIIGTRITDGPWEYLKGGTAVGYQRLQRRAQEKLAAAPGARPGTEGTTR